LLAELEARGGKRSARIAEALALWLKQRRLGALEQACAHLAALEGGDLQEAEDCAAAMASDG
jgi:hypothetical protein